MWPLQDLCKTFAAEKDNFHKFSKGDPYKTFTRPFQLNMYNKCDLFSWKDLGKVIFSTGNKLISVLLILSVIINDYHYLALTT